MEENKLTQTCFAKNLGKLNFTSIISVSVDANANIKTVLDTESYLYDCSVECVNGKMIVSGKIGVRVLYIDTDNISNTVCDSQSFSETLTDSSITADSIINICNSTSNCTVLQAEGGLKINVDVTIMPVMYLNLALNTGAGGYDNLIVKKSEVTTCAIDQKIDTNFDYTINLETKDAVSKILIYNAHFTPSQVRAQDGSVLVEGKIFSKLIYETISENESEIKELCNSYTIKTDVPVANLVGESLLDLSFCMDRNKLSIETEMDDGQNVVVVKHNVKVCGVSFKTLSIDLVDDMYSVENELELSLTTRDFSHADECAYLTETVSGELPINDDEPAIDRVVTNINILPEITNSYIKDNVLILEGIISSQLIYLDENKEYKNKSTQLPFIIDTKIGMEKLDCLHFGISVSSANAKAKRGTIIELEYQLEITICSFVSVAHQMIDNFTLTKPLDFGAYDYQIFVAKPNESMWDICKRIKVSPDDICKYNPNLPQTFEGGEKIIIKRG